MFRSLQSIQFHYLSLSIPADHHLPRTDRTPIFNLSRDRRMITKSIKDSCQDGLTLIGIIERNSFRLCPTPPQKNAPLFPPALDKSGKGQEEAAKKAVLIKKVRFLIKGGCNSFRKVGIVAEGSWWHAIFSGPGRRLDRRNRSVRYFSSMKGRPSRVSRGRGGG